MKLKKQKQKTNKNLIHKYSQTTLFLCSEQDTELFSTKSACPKISPKTPTSVFHFLYDHEINIFYIMTI